jgi:two-component system, OmpR family, phosphate regulon sensor histidine kinase PhoR
MKKPKIHLSLVIITLVCLIVLVGIQIVWILKAANMQEAQFNRSVSMAMNRIVENLSNNQAICSQVNNCMMEDKEGTCFLIMQNRQEWANMGNMIRKDLLYYGINLDFEFDIVEAEPGQKSQGRTSVYFSDDLVDILQKSGFELRIRFPEKRDFILAQIGYIFVGSIALIILVTLSFVLIFGFYKKEKKLTENIVDFINNMTHEFKTPLTNIALANSMISKSESVLKDDKLTFYSGVIKAEHGKLRQRVEELLRTSFSESGEPIFIDIIDVSLAAENVVQTFAVQAGEKGGTISFKKECEHFLVTGNSELIQTAIGNIVDNAIKYCTTAPQINLTLSSKNNSVFITVSDNGIGIEKSQLDLIFGKFYRVPTGNINEISGFGLGLFHVRNIVEKMGGKIKVSSIKGKGSIFTIELPSSSNL